jgi:hypothetical protein
MRVIGLVFLLVAVVGYFFPSLRSQLPIHFGVTDSDVRVAAGLVTLMGVAMIAWGGRKAR